MPDTWIVQNAGGADMEIHGRDLYEAVRDNLHAIAKLNRIGSAAGYRLHRCECEYRKGVLGGKGGVEIRLWWSGLPLAHRPAGPAFTLSCIWVHAQPDDLIGVPLILDDGAYDRIIYNREQIND